MEEVILVDENDQEVGTMEKLEAHQKGKLHRAISVFVFNSEGQMMLQRRAEDKYHSGGLWSNTCCSHPRPGEDTKDAAHRRLREEMGLSCSLEKIHAFVYRTEFPDGLIEHEYDHVFIGTTEEKPTLNPEEASDWRWVEPVILKQDVSDCPEKYTYWFRTSLEDVLNKVQSK